MNAPAWLRGLSLPTLIHLLVGVLLTIAVAMAAFIYWFEFRDEEAQQRLFAYHQSSVLHAARIQSELTPILNQVHNEVTNPRLRPRGKALVPLNPTSFHQIGLEFRAMQHLQELFDDPRIAPIMDKANRQFQTLKGFQSNPVSRHERARLDALQRLLYAFEISVMQLQRLHAKSREAMAERLQVAKSTGLNRLLPVLGVLLLLGGGMVQGIITRIGVLHRRREEAEAEARRAQQVAEDANRAKSGFLANVSHEIRTPLNAIIGTTDLLREEDLSQEHRRYLDICAAAGETLLNLINDILDLSKVEADQITLESVEFDLAEVVGNIRAILGLQAGEKGLMFHCEIEPGAPERLIGDPVRLNQILFNLVGNAVKFTSVGEVRLVVRLQAREGDVALMRFTVSDTGSGIPPEQLDAIFNAFVQVGNTTTRRGGGTGLGLTISTRLAERMGGLVELERSVEGEGSVFALSVPFPMGVEGGLRVSLSAVRALVVSYDQHERVILMKSLEGLGCMEITGAFTGEEGLRLFLEARETPVPYGLVVVDCPLTDMEGLKLVSSMRFKSPSVPILITSSQVCALDSRQVQTAGGSGVLLKPVKRAALERAIAASIKGSHLSLAMPAPSQLVWRGASGRGTPDRPWRVLVVDDLEDNCLLVQAYLKHGPFRVDTSADGRSALEKLRYNRYDLVLMDIQMPEMDGYEATRRFRALESETGVGRTPIIALTAYAMTEDVNMALAAGCDLHLAKPIRKQVLLEGMHNLLNLASGRGTG